nr:class I tRNA ligase family protein [Plantactinospora sp. BC1]
MTYLTTPIYYVNDLPHVGHAYSTVLADALARWERLCGRPVRLVTGTDEHGAKVRRAAAEAGIAPATLADRTAGRFRATWDRLGIGYDEFVRTTSARHRETVTELLTRVYEAGHLRPGRYDGRYCVGCEAYATELVCAVHGRPTELVGEENWFFRLSEFARPLAEWFDRCPEAVRPAARRNEALGWLRRGLTDFSISRAGLDWGIPLPWEPSQVTYVWFDALGSYLTPPAGPHRSTPAGGRPGTSSARTSCGSTRSTGRRSCSPPTCRCRSGSPCTASCCNAAARSRSPGSGPSPWTTCSTGSVRRGSATTCSGTTRSARTGSSRSPRWRRATTPTWPTPSATCSPG